MYKCRYIYKCCEFIMVYEHSIPGKYILIFPWLISSALPIDLSSAPLDFFAFITTSHG